MLHPLILYHHYRVLLFLLLPYILLLLSRGVPLFYCVVRSAHTICGVVPGVSLHRTGLKKIGLQKYGLDRS